MSTPSVEVKPGKYIFQWEQENLTGEVSRITNHSDGRLTCNLKVSTTNPSYSSHLCQMNFNLSSLASRRDAKKVLSERYKEQVNWDEILELLCVKTQEIFETGEPVEELWLGNEDLKPPEYVLKPILQKGLPTVIFGEKGVKKTTLALLCGICIALPWKDNPYSFETTSKALNVTLLDWEQDSYVVRYYGSQICRGLGLPAVPIHYRHCSVPLAKDLEHIQTILVEHKTDVVILDSLGAACGGDLNKTDAPLAFFSALRQLKITSLIIAQTRKDDEDRKKKSIFGSTYFHYYARSIFELCQSGASTNSDQTVALFHRDSNYAGKSRPIGFNFHYNSNTITVTSEPVVLDEFRKKVSSQHLILDALKGGKLSIGELVERTKIDVPVLRVLLTKLKKHGEICNPGEGTWGLATK